MKRLHLFGLALMAIFAVSATASAVANAELKILPEASEGSPLTFQFENTTGTQTTLESVGGKKIACTAVTGTGQATSERLGTVKFEFTGCLNTATLAKCTGLDDMTSGQILFEAPWHLRHLLPTSEGVALVVLPPHVHFSCAGILFLLLGCVASMDLLTEKSGVSIVEKLSSSVFVDFLQEKGVQKPLTIDNDTSTADESCMLTIQEEAKAAEEAGQLGEGTMKNFKQGANSPTLLVMLK